ncbi:sodium:solute symporter family transporter [[Clostridium] fimetarium]|uniref:Solute:Na+ symporter, SSS family n=1 Tax=[Clostridium] fimetarium TaxID=99656 RepID=A0A1I0QZB9_9FIRM|nr:sodium:solute symporter [[Clostridium] fimetarium]SEW33281.1 solute:Na+ symporter, SSS family [[Clostridium] fimetarium]
MAVKILLVIIFFVIMIGVGWYSRKHTTSVNDFVLGGRGVGPWLTAFAYGTTYFSAVVFVGYAGQFGFKYGIAATWIGIGNAMIGSLLAWVILGRRTRIMSKYFDSKTMPDYFGKRYKSNKLRIAASMIAFVFLIPYTASVYNGLSRLFGMAFDIPFKYCVIAMAVLTGIYIVLGGYMATAINDFIQGIVMLFGIVAVIAAVLIGKGGFMSAIHQLADVPSTVQNGAYASFFGPDPVNLFGVIVLTSLGTWGLPQMIHKFYTIKDEKSIKTGTIISTVFALIISGGCYFLGGFGRLFDSPAIHNANGTVIFDAIIPSMLSTLPDIIVGIVIVLVLSASMSTLSALVLTSSSTLTLDFLKDNFIKNMSEKKQLLYMRILLIFFIVVSVVIALDPPTFIAQLMGISWGALAGSFLAPFIYGLYWKGVTKYSVWACFACGVGVTVSNIYLKFIASPINAGAMVMVAGLVIVPVVSLLTPKMKQQDVEEIFECYEEKVVVELKESLADEELN